MKFPSAGRRSMKAFVFAGVLALTGPHGRAQDTTRLNLLFLGDIMQHDSQLAAARLSDTTFDYRPCLRWLAPHLQSADFTIGNLELTLAGPPFKGYPLFSAPDALVRHLKWAGVDALVTANNHSLDRGRKGLERTVDVLTQTRYLHTGTFKDSLDRAQRYPLWLEKNGFRVALLNYTYGTNGIPTSRPNIVNRIDTVLIKADLARARAGFPDAMVVFFHWGDEYQLQPNTAQRQLAALCFREGVHLIIGAHPHVVQPMAWYKSQNQLVAYSLGNFVSGQRSRYRNGGATLQVTLEKTTGSVPRTRLADARYHLHYVHRDEQQHYHILPAAAFEDDTLVIKTAAARAELNRFLTDSRTLFQESKYSIPEHKPDTETVFRIWLSADAALVPHPLWNFFPVEQMERGGQTYWVAGHFYEHALAVQAAIEIADQTPYKLAAVVQVNVR